MQIQVCLAELYTIILCPGIQEQAQQYDLLCLLTVLWAPTVSEGFGSKKQQHNRNGDAG